MLEVISGKCFLSELSLIEGSERTYPFLNDFHQPTAVIGLAVSNVPKKWHGSIHPLDLASAPRSTSIWYSNSFLKGRIKKKFFKLFCELQDCIWRIPRRRTLAIAAVHNSHRELHNNDSDRLKIYNAFLR